MRLLSRWEFYGMGFTIAFAIHSFDPRHSVSMLV